MKRLVAVALAFAFAIAVSSATGTDATFSGRTRSTQAFSLLAVGTPSQLTAQPLGNDVSLSWSAGQHATAYQVRAGNTCVGMTTVAEPTATSHSDTPDVAAGESRCYGVLSTLDQWTSVTGNPAVIVRVGFVATSVAIVEGACGTNGFLDCGDQFVIELNQPANVVTPDAVCAESGAIVLGCEDSVGTLSGGTLDADARYAATSSWSNGNRILTITVGARTQGTVDPTMAGPWTLTPTGLTSATGDVAICATAGDCRPTTS
ncbi:MAG TPA: hypothetical protein VM938_11690 [Acidimicrobiales bacterium]|nr:hypothetical protein [Acidimicrobiales bacterium]